MDVRLKHDGLLTTMDWSTCSADIIFLIFKSVDDKSLLTCLTVCRLWRDVACHIIQVKDSWQNVAENSLFNRALSFKEKSTLSWREICLNSLFWINLNTIRVQFDKAWNLKRDNVKSIHVYKDKVIAVYDDCVELFDAVTSLSVVKKPGLIDYQETEHMTVVCFIRNELYIRFKHNCFEYSLNCNIYKLADNCCFIMDCKNTLWRCKCCRRSGGTNGPCFVVRSYDSVDSVIDLNVYDKNIYVLTRNGNIQLVKQSGLHYKTIARLDRPDFHESPLIVMFLRHSVAYSVPCEDGSKNKIVSRIGDTDEVVIACPGMTCAVSHEEMLLLGYEDGTVEVCYPQQLLSGNSSSLKFNIRDHVKDVRNVSIIGMDVHEARGAPYLFVATRYSIFKIVLQQLSY